MVNDVRNEIKKEINEEIDEFFRAIKSVTKFEKKKIFLRWIHKARDGSWKSTKWVIKSNKEREWERIKN